MNRIVTLCFTTNHTISRIIHTSKKDLQSYPVRKIYHEGGTKFRLHFDGRNSILVKYENEELANMSSMDIFKYGKNRP